MTASRTRRSRSLSSGIGISSNMLTTSECCQVGRQCVEPEPSKGARTEDEPAAGGHARRIGLPAVECPPPCRHPAFHACPLLLRHFQSRRASQSQVHLL